MKPSIGQAKTRLDGKLKVTGSATYSADWQIKGLTYAATVLSSIPSGAIAKIDLTQAKKVRGVVEIITHENAPSIHIFNPMNKAFLGDADYPFQSPKVTYYGQPVAVVVAESLEGAEQASRLIKVHYADIGGELDFEKRSKTDAHKKRFSMQVGMLNASKGKVDEGIKKAKHLVQETYTTPIENHHPMETSSTIALFENGNLKIYDATQGVSNVYGAMGSAFDTGKDHTFVTTKFVGGGFGCKGSIWSHVFIACLAAKITKRPVKLVTSRISMSTNVGYRASTIQDLTLASDENGKLLAIKHETVNPTAIDKSYQLQLDLPSRA